MKIGVMVESFRVGLDEGLKAAAGIKADGVQIYATGDALKPDTLNAKGRSELRRRIADLGLEISALCGDFGGHGFQIAAENAEKIDATRKVIDLALDLGCRIVTTHIGVVPAAADHPRYAVLAKACAAIGRYANEMNAVLAIETGPEPAAILRGFLDDIGMDAGLGVNFDPANLVMVCRENIPEAVRILGKYIVHTHAKDGLNLKPVDPEQLYGAFAGDATVGFDWRAYIREVPLGKGQVPFAVYLATLRETGYDGFLTVEREAGENPRADISEAVQYLRSLIK